MVLAWILSPGDVERGRSLEFAGGLACSNWQAWVPVSSPVSTNKVKSHCCHPQCWLLADYGSARGLIWARLGGSQHAISCNNWDDPWCLSSDKPLIGCLAGIKESSRLALGGGSCPELRPFVRVSVPSDPPSVTLKWDVLGNVFPLPGLHLY